jgi:hypothetical protein
MTKNRMAMDGWSSASLKAALSSAGATEQAMERGLSSANLQTALGTVNPSPPSPPPVPPENATASGSSSLSK